MARLSAGLADHQADDLAQEIMVRLLRDLTRGRTPDIPFRAVVSQVCRWEAARMAQAAAPASVELSESLPAPGADELIETIDRDGRGDLASRFETLPPRVREAFVLKYIDDLDNSEIVARMGVTGNNLHQLLHRGRQILARGWDD